MGDASGRPEVSRDALVGRAALELGWVTAAQLREALAEQWTDLESGRGKSRSLGAILVARGDLSEKQLDQILEKIGAVVPSFPPFGKYVLHREIGRGAVGAVYEAEDTELRRKVALKLLITPPGRDPQESKPEDERFLRETQLHKSLPPHAGIVPVLEAGVIDGRRYLAMELVEGAPLGAWAKHGSITVRQRVAMLRDVALAIHHAHEHGILHRDLKPENILVDKSHQPRITDFGLAKLVGATGQPLATATGMSLGTPAYMSPEQIQGVKDLDRRTDLYPIGVMLYEILTGRLPFEGENPYELMMKVMNEEVLPPSKITSLQINPVLYRNLENICLIALAKDPRDRYPDARSLANDLSLWLKGEDIRAVLPKRLRRWRAKKALPRLALVAAVAAVAFGGTFAWLRARAPRPAEDLSRALAAAPVLPASVQPGCIAECFAGLNFNALGLRRIDRRAAFDDPAQPLWAEAPGAWTSRRWTGYLRAPQTGTYAFDLSSQEHSRLVLDGQELAAGAGTRAVSRVLRSGLHRLVLEHSHTAADDTVSISWKKPGAASAEKIGPSSLFHSVEDFTAVDPQPAGRTVLSSVPGAEEGEMLTVLESSGHPPDRKSFGYYSVFWKGTWSGSEHLWWGSGVRVGDRLKVRFAAGETGPGTLVLSCTHASDHGIYKISVNGAVVAEAIDFWSDDLSLHEVEFKNVELKAGANDLEFEIVGSNPKAREWAAGNGLFKMGLDYLLVR